MLDCFELLGLEPREHDPRAVASAYLKRRQALFTQLDDPERAGVARIALDRLHVAFHTLATSTAQRAALAALTSGETREQALRRLVEASLEQGLLRHTRRQHILLRGRELGFSDFHTQLLIAQVQLGDAAALVRTPGRRAEVEAGRAAARFAAVGILGLAMFLSMVHWLQLG